MLSWHFVLATCNNLSFYQEKAAFFSSLPFVFSLCLVIKSGMQKHIPLFPWKNPIQSRLTHLFSPNINNSTFSLTADSFLKSLTFLSILFVGIKVWGTTKIQDANLPRKGSSSCSFFGFLFGWLKVDWRRNHCPFPLLCDYLDSRSLFFWGVGRCRCCSFLRLSCIGNSSLWSPLLDFSRVLQWLFRGFDFLICCWWRGSLSLARAAIMACPISCRFGNQVKILLIRGSLINAGFVTWVWPCTVNCREAPTSFVREKSFTRWGLTNGVWMI